MRLNINAGGLEGFFNGVCSFLSEGVNEANSNNLINSFSNIINKTNNLNGGVGALSIGLGYVQTRKEAEESRKIAIDNVKSKTDNFIQMALRVDAAVATMVTSSQEEFYQTNPWLRPSTPTSAWEKIWEKIWDSAGDTVSMCWNGIKEFYSSNIGKIIFDGLLNRSVSNTTIEYASMMLISKRDMNATGLTNLSNTTNKKWKETQEELWNRLLVDYNDMVDSLDTDDMLEMSEENLNWHIEALVALREGYVNYYGKKDVLGILAKIDNRIMQLKGVPIINTVITEECFEKMGISDASLKLLDENFVESFKKALLNAGITTELSMKMLLANIGQEIGSGAKVLEILNKDGSVVNPLIYTQDTRGAGLIQITGENQIFFYQYMQKIDPDNKLLKIYADNIYGKVVYENGIPKCNKNGEQYICYIFDWNQAKQEAEEMGVTIDKSPAQYISNNYTIESATWYWGEYNYFGQNGSLDDYILREKDCDSNEVFENVCEYVNGGKNGLDERITNWNALE